MTNASHASESAAPETPSPLGRGAFEVLVGRQEIAERLDITVSAVDTWRRRHPSFPEPMTTLSGTPIWRWREVENWARSTPRRRGRPRKRANG